MNRSIRSAAVFCAAAAIVVASGGIANAEGNGQPVTDPANILKLETFKAADNSPADCSVLRWKVPTYGSDSPIDTNGRALVANICDGEYADAYTGTSLLDRPVGQVKNLSYDERRDTPGAGAPRISVIFKNGDVAYLTSSTCSIPLAVSQTWNRADFTGYRHAGCSFAVTGATGGTYSSSEGQSAWDAYVAAHPDQVVSLDFLVYDEPGHYVIDRLALGTNRLYNTSSVRVIYCHNNENLC